MTSRITLLIAISLLILACKKLAPTQVKIYSSDGIETLNGHVKEIYSSSSSSKHNFSVLIFNKEGQMANRITSNLGIITTENKTDSTIEKTNVTYSYQYKNGRIVSIVCETVNKDTTASSTLKLDALGRLMNNEGDTTVENHGIDSYKYDKRDNLIEWISSESAASVEPTIFRFSYDNLHRVIDARLCAPRGGTYQRTTYEYKALDSKRNWIKAIVRFKNYQTSEPDPRVDTITRKITYY